MRDVKRGNAFICFTENINRPAVSDQADYIASNLDDVFKIIKEAEQNG